jgi:hypothetical protein
LTSAKKPIAFAFENDHSTSSSKMPDISEEGKDYALPDVVDSEEDKFETDGSNKQSKQSFSSQ